ncbi:hypothetical protein GIB67_027853 [Kingdonia uniflora]|uniref:Peptidase M16 N-terminal domain-containing protein n=1 Tax=Kingdonia uniflora TaxID=39325 RepID=A0A7J7P532_9MAGN|nr:hypothetical protein GIB67_027853 [Kingdonia uniflora]
MDVNRSSSDDIVIKAPTDKRLYRVAAAALCVGMGSFSDPIEAQGLAHFLEHMLFMGSAEFPDENEVWSMR